MKMCKGIQPQTPFVLVTGYGDYDPEQDAANQGAYAVLRKPVDSTVLVSVVKRSILRKSARVAPTRMALRSSSSKEAFGDWIQTMNERLLRAMETTGRPVTKLFRRNRPGHFSGYKLDSSGSLLNERRSY